LFKRKCPSEFNLSAKINVKEGSRKLFVKLPFSFEPGMNLSHGQKDFDKIFVKHCHPLVDLILQKIFFFVEFSPNKVDLLYQIS
jgi:hypothetical protein